MWFGRIAPEKGTHLAIDAAVLAGRSLVLAGPDRRSRLLRRRDRARGSRSPGIEYAGHLTHAALDRLVGEASAVLVTPCWDEPYGLVVAEALACGTPVCAFARGALPELLDDELRPARRARRRPPRSPARSATCRQLSRDAAREHAIRACSLDRMVDEYADLYALARRRAAVA